MKITYNNVNPNKLHDELVRADIIPILVQNGLKDGEYIASNTWVTFADDTDMVKVQAIISAHNPTPLPKLPTNEERISALEDAMLALMG